MRSLSDTADKVQTAVVFAESNNPEWIEDLNKSKNEMPLSPPKLLVVGQESYFSDTVIDYALETSSRLSYEIVALNFAPLPSNTMSRFNESREKLCADFLELSRKNIAGFKEKAESAAIPFTHIVKFEDAERAVEEVVEEIDSVEFIVSDTPEPETLRSQKTNAPRGEVFVYSMLS
jgi:hypothetical protein